MTEKHATVLFDTTHEAIPDTYRTLQMEITGCDLRIKNVLRLSDKSKEGKREDFAREMGRRSGLLAAAAIFGFSERQFKCERWDGSTITKVQAKVPADRRI